MKIIKAKLYWKIEREPAGNIDYSEIGIVETDIEVELGFVFINIEKIVFFNDVNDENGESGNRVRVYLDSDDYFVIHCNIDNFFKVVRTMIYNNINFVEV